MPTVYIQQKDNDWLSPNQATAAFGFNKLGYDVKPFIYEDMLDGKVPVSPETIIHGGIGAVVEALKIIGIERPQHLDIPECLRSFAHRRIWDSTIGDIRKQISSRPDAYVPTFIKPLTGHKAFTGYVVKKFSDLIITARFDNEYPILCSSVVNFLAEYRFFILNKKVLGMSHYSGNPLRMPKTNIVSRVIEAFDNAPVAYSIDVGVIEGSNSYETILVEINDAFSLGCYGLNAISYCNMIEERWKEMVSIY